MSKESDPWGLIPESESEPTQRKASVSETIASLFVTANKAFVATEPTPVKRSRLKRLISEAPPSKPIESPEASIDQAREVKIPCSHKRVNEVKALLDKAEDLSLEWLKIQESCFDIGDPESEYDELESSLKLSCALTPGNLQDALNQAEDNARRAHRLYIVAKLECERLELEQAPVMASMKAEALEELQWEKDNKSRAKSITEGDVKDRMTELYSDEYKTVMLRQIKAQAMIETLKTFADLWKQRCFSLAAMLNAGKRS